MRKVVLTASAVGAILRGLAYFPTSNYGDISQLEPVERWFPLFIWGWIWMLVGGWCLLAIFVREVSGVAMTALTALLTIWGGSYIWAWLSGEIHRAWVTGALFLTAAVWVGSLRGYIEKGE